MDRLARGTERKLARPRDRAPWRSDVRDLSHDARSNVAGVEERELSKTSVASDDSLPGLSRGLAERRDRAQTCNDDGHVGIAGAGRSKRGMAKSAPPLAV